MTNDKPHGTLINSNSGVRIPCTLKQQDDAYIDVAIDGERYGRGFELDDGWSFEPDPTPLPTEPGTVIVVTFPDYSIRSGTAAWLLTTSGLWESYANALNREDMQAFLERNNATFEVIFPTE